MGNALAVRQRITLLRIDDMMAMSHRYELEFRSALKPSAVGYQGRKQCVSVVRQRGKRSNKRARKQQGAAGHVRTPPYRRR